MLPSHEPGLTLLATELGCVASHSIAIKIIDRVLAGEELLAIMSDMNATRVRDVVHLAVEMEILRANGRQMTPGNRSDAWTKLTEAERVRALTRMWIVDDTGHAPVPGTVRHGVVTALRGAEPGRRYDANSVARLAAIPVSNHESVPERHAAGAEAPRPTIERTTIDRAFIALSVIGTVSVTLDQRGRPTAIGLDEAGLNAIR